MTQYVCGLYRNKDSFGEATVEKVLVTLFESRLDFFPLRLRVSEQEERVFVTPQQFAREFVPSIYLIDGADAHIPFESHNGTNFIIVESSKPAISPGSILLEFSDEVFEQQKWDFAGLLALFKNLVLSFEPDFGWIYDRKHRNRQYYSDIMFDFDTKKVPIGIFWMNYYGPDWVRNLGKDKVQQIKERVSHFEWLDRSILFAIQQEPYREEAHSRNQMALEREIGLKEIQDRFPKKR